MLQWYFDSLVSQGSAAFPICILKPQIISFAYKSNSSIVVLTVNELATSIIKKGRKRHIGREKERERLFLSHMSTEDAQRNFLLIGEFQENPRILSPRPDCNCMFTPN